MKTFVILDGLFTRRDGVPASNNTAYDFFERYLDVFSEVTVVARCFDTEDPTAAPVSGKGVDLWALPGYQGPAGFLGALPRIVPVLYRVLRNKRTAILRVPATIPIIVGLLLFMLRRPFAVELMADPYDAYSPDALRHPLSRLFQFLFTRSTGFLCRHAVAAAYVTRETLQTRYPPRAGEDAHSFTSLDLKADAYVAATRSENDFNVENPRLLQVAMMQNYYKGHDIALNGLAHLRRRGVPATLRLVGDGPLRPEIEKMARELGLESSVTFCGKLAAGPDIWCEMDHADILILPSRQEGLPRVLLEAMARALPCVSSRVGGTPELMDDAQLMGSLTASDLADKVSHLISHPELLVGCSERNRALADAFDYQIVRRARIAFYRKVMELSG